jgi:hypothetical protein
VRHHFLKIGASMGWSGSVAKSSNADIGIKLERRDVRWRSLTWKKVDIIRDEDKGHSHGKSSHGETTK